MHVEQGKLELPYGLQPVLEILGGEHLVEQGSRQLRARIHVPAHPRTTSHSQQKFSMNWLGNPPRPTRPR
jgi:hypothetical protein